MLVVETLSPQPYTVREPLPCLSLAWIRAFANTSWESRTYRSETLRSWRRSFVTTGPRPWRSTFEDDTDSFSISASRPGLSTGSFGASWPIGDLLVGPGANGKFGGSSTVNTRVLITQQS